MKKALQALHGIRSAIMAIVLLAEVVAQGLGYEAGPAFAMVHGVFASVGWDAANVVFDPAVVGAAVLTIYAAVQRFRSWAKAPKG